MHAYFLITLNHSLPSTPIARAFPTFFPDFRDMMYFVVARYLLNELDKSMFLRG